MQVYFSPALPIRSSAGVGMTPPKVLGAPKPTSSVMISSTLGAPLGGTTRGAHHALDWAALSLMTPPNFGSGGGSCFPSMVVVAAGEPGVPVVCWAATGKQVSTAKLAAQNARTVALMNYPPGLGKQDALSMSGRIISSRNSDNSRPTLA